MRSVKTADSKFKDIGEGIGGAAAIAFAFLTPMLRARRTKWGATDAEVHRSLPGDDLVPHSKGGYTHAITIHAPAARVWPWLVQMGQGRGGFYSYEFLENLVGCDIHNADRIIPEFQHLEVGDGIRLYPKGDPMMVAYIEPCQALVLLTRVDTQTGNTFELTDTMPEKYVNLIWMWFLDEVDEGTTRLISRSRNDYNRSLVNALIFGVIGSIACVMSRKMLLGIKQRAEAATSN